MLHLIQENLFKEVHYDLLINTLKRFEIPHIIVRVFPFVDYVVDLNDIPDSFDNVEDLPQIDPGKQRVWVWGSLKMTRICAERGWKPGTMINENHTYDVYSKWWGNHLLNSDSEILTIKDELPWVRVIYFSDQWKTIKHSPEKSLMNKCGNIQKKGSQNSIRIHVYKYVHQKIFNSK